MGPRFATLGAAVVLALFLAAACRAEGEKARAAGQPTQPAASQSARRNDPTAQDYQLPPLPRARVVLKDAYGGSHPVDAEIAATGISRERGLMWRTELAPGKGMLFIFPGEEVHSFWMKNTLIPLDLIFIGKDRRIAGIVHQATPRTTAPRSVNKPSVYVLEVPGGWAEKAGIQSGSTVEMEGISGIAAQP